MAAVKKFYLPLGGPAYFGDRPAQETKISVVSYDSESAQMNYISDADELSWYRNDAKIVWINVSGLKNVDFLKRLGDLFNIHPLSIEDVLHTGQQPKMELFEEYKFLSLKTIQREKKFSTQREQKKIIFPFFGKKQKHEQDEETEEFLFDQISVIIMKNVLMTFQEIHGDSFDGVRKRILEGLGEIRKAGTEYLAYAIIDSVVDEYFLALNYLEEDIDDFEDRAITTSDNTFLEEIQDTKKYLVQIRRAISPLKENMIIIARQDRFFKSEELKPYLQDLNENLNNAIMTVENHRERLSNSMDVNLSVLSQQTNKVMKVLAIISTIFIPLTFIAGVYGMNFEFMPETKNVFGYPVVLGCMGLIAVIMIIVFKIRRWF